MSRIATLLLLSVFFTIALSQRAILGGERSKWYFGSYSENLIPSDAYLYDPRIGGFGSNAFDSAYALSIRPSNNNYWWSSGYWNYYNSGPPESSGSFISETYQYENLNYTKEYYVSPTLSALRSYFTFTAINEPVQLEIEVYSDIPYSFNTLFGDYNNNGVIDNEDEWYVTGVPFVDPAQRNYYPFVTWSVFGPGATETPIDTDDGYGQIINTFELELLPGIPQSLLFFAELSLTSDEAVDAASKYENILELRKTDLLFGLTDSDFNQIANWGLQTPRKVTSYTGICDFADEIKDRVSKLRSNERHSFNQPWRC